MTRPKSKQRRQSKSSGLAREIRRRQHEARRRADRARAATAAATVAAEPVVLDVFRPFVPATSIAVLATTTVPPVDVDHVRRTLQETAAAESARRLAEALAVTDEFAWQPWGYECAEFDPAPAPARPLALVPSAQWVDTVVGPRLRVVIPMPPRRSRAGARSRFSHPHLALAGAAA